MRVMWKGKAERRTSCLYLKEFSAMAGSSSTDKITCNANSAGIFSTTISSPRVTLVAAALTAWNASRADSGFADGGSLERSCVGIAVMFLPYTNGEVWLCLQGQRLSLSWEFFMNPVTLARPILP